MYCYMDLSVARSDCQCLSPRGHRRRCLYNLPNSKVVVIMPGGHDEAVGCEVVIICTASDLYTTDGATGIMSRAQTPS